MITVTIHKAKTELSKLIAMVEAGEDISIARGKTVVAEIIRPRSKARMERKPGGWLGRLAVPAGAFDPLPEDELGLWEGSGEATS
jgi:antitoxin (DNA-binding transcriptional repressor) of toxin-antitoxin stability system